MSRVLRLKRRDGRGQSLVEFALAITVFLFMLMGAIDLGRGVYQLNAVGQAAREIARTTSVHPGSTLGSSAETASTVATQRRLVPGLSVTSFSCLDIAGGAVAGACTPGNWVRVDVNSRFEPVLPFLQAFGPFNLRSASSAEIE